VYALAKDAAEREGKPCHDLPGSSLVTAARTVTYCARCGALETMHEIRADGTRGKRLGMPGECPGYQPGRIEERPPEDELRRRLDAVQRIACKALVCNYASHRADCCCHLEPQAAAVLAAVLLAARGET
jgi:hypothetical protein